VSTGYELLLLLLLQMLLEVGSRCVALEMLRVRMLGTTHLLHRCACRMALRRRRSTSNVGKHAAGLNLRHRLRPLPLHHVAVRLGRVKLSLTLSHLHRVPCWWPPRYLRHALWRPGDADRLGWRRLVHLLLLLLLPSSPTALLIYTRCLLSQLRLLPRRELPKFALSVRKVASVPKSAPLGRLPSQAKLGLRVLRRAPEPAPRA